jgi:predicted branched-subunit amino acid permease
MHHGRAEHEEAGVARARTVGGDSTTPASHPAGILRQAVTDVAPLIAGYLPFGFVLGATIADSDVPNLAGWASSPLVFAGASQLAIIQLLDSGAGIIVVVATALVINLRHLMYSGAIAPYFRDTPLWWRLAAPHLMADPTYSLAAVRFPQLPDKRSQRLYWSAFGSMLLVAWSAMTAAGILLGAQLPASLSFELAVPLVFFALLVPTVTDRPTLAAAMVGGLVTVAAHGLPLHLGLITGALSGVVAGLALDTSAPDRSENST